MQASAIKKALERVLIFSPRHYSIAIILTIAVSVTLFLSNNTTQPTTLPPQENYLPQIKANFDNCNINTFSLTVSGWALLDLPENTIKIHLYANGPAGTIKLLTRRLYRKDVSDFLKVRSDYHLHGFSASTIGYKLLEHYGTSIELYIEDSKGVMHYGGKNVCTTNQL